MKIKELNELKEKSQEQLKLSVSKKKLELMKNKVKIAGGQEKNLKKNWTLRKEISQLMTLIKQKGMNE